MEKLREQYNNEVVPALMKKFEYKSIMQVPKLDKVVINIGLGDLKENPKALEFNYRFSGSKLQLWGFETWGEIEIEDAIQEIQLFLEGGE